MDLFSILDGTPEPSIVDLHLDTDNFLGEYDLATPMFEFQKELTDQIVSLHYPDILKYCETNDTTELIIKSLEICVENCMLVASHPYLLIRHYMPKNFNIRDLPAKLAETSGKFSVLRNVINVIQQQQVQQMGQTGQTGRPPAATRFFPPLLLLALALLASTLVKHIAVIMRNDQKTFDLTETLLLGVNGHKQILRYVGNSIKRETNKSSRSNYKDSRSTYIHLLPSDGEITRYVEELPNVKFDVLIALDGTVDTKGEFVRSLRGGCDTGYTNLSNISGSEPVTVDSISVDSGSSINENNQNGLYENGASASSTSDSGGAVILKLIPMYSIEHSLQHYAEFKNDPSYLYKLISSIVCLRDQVGNLLPDLFPIYNQNLSYLSHTFFDHVFKRESQTFPKWPLPELPNVPKFSPSDVERSLLTEVVYHYTPYDSNFNSNSNDTGSNGNGEGSSKKRKTYYENKRLQLDYVTNPLKHDYASLSGIHTHHLTALKHLQASSIMTHMLLLKLNSGYHDLDLIREEFESYIAFNKPEKQRSFGRRVEEIKRTLTTLIEDYDHNELRLLVTQKKINKRNEENENYSKKITDFTNSLLGFSESHDFSSDSPKANFVKQQLKMWNLQNEIKSLAEKTKAKSDEKSYMTTELQACEQSIKQSADQSEKAVKECKLLNEQIDEAMENETKEANEFSALRAQKLADLEKAMAANDALRANFAQTLKFLRDTAHIKKRKGRGLTPNGR